MATIPSLKITHALASHGESNNPVYPQKNLLPFWASLFDLWLEVTRPWPGSAVGGQTDEVTLWLKQHDGTFVVVEKWKLRGLITFPLNLKLPHRYLVDGVSEMYFEVVTHDGTKHESEPVFFTIDPRVPLGDATPGEPLVPEEITSGPGVTIGYLKAHCHVVQIGIPAYTGCQYGDTAHVTFGPPNAPVVAVILIDPLADKTVVALPAHIFERDGSGVRLMYYRIYSRAGVASKESKGKFIKVNFPPV
ncbi:hypothetical protein [Pseudomonas moraviensis]|uniref:Uncharacterized protein n=1 Tax=Pseudomonas moraviensis TaxID=321662 RepID=A0A7Z0AVV8_9PSED|nr:hypothetical protein [Pseudomonas moraviensis]NYH11719.1 hypothetical protein [Pseudomonas moraviensis]